MQRGERGGRGRGVRGMRGGWNGWGRGRWTPGSDRGESEDTEQAGEALLALLVGMGLHVDVTTTDGSVYSGIFHASRPDDLGICLKMATRVPQDPQAKHATAPLIRELIITGKDVLMVTARNVDIPGLEKDDSFLTDTAISSSALQASSSAQRELKPWVPPSIDSSDLTIPGSSADDDLLTSPSATSPTAQTRWDQFAVNERLFGVTTDYQEELYTTKLDKSKPDFKKRESEAARIASEIQGQTTANPHLAEERGQAVQEANEDEEEKSLRSTPSTCERSCASRCYCSITDSRTVCQTTSFTFPCSFTSWQGCITCTQSCDVRIGRSTFHISSIRSCTIICSSRETITFFAS
ncbi:hypothetical protein M427DRAFT_349998 [Gonapodya prolifera JEL478]|uniref:LsmAD domain-containing protein n=1 Tax=Gonapodya prolifera (strain JEL478) TaxID=1344416 RepID=A0A139AWA6_GONPJ|nr:hypothetical protein M427DRAFT_349998 [Gonapodya prolifera JEL478]|eukprot:KXS20989.1 hypothetical protein M427DRAFT_349998 [Gonapodya prolifera JEL478]